jgi:CheY-like chemotaxis protein
VTAFTRRIAPIVLVEDDPNDAFFVKDSLEHARISNKLVIIESVVEARQRMTPPPSGPESPALFVLDLHFPGGETGLDFLRWLRQHEAPFGSTPVMILTGSERAEDRQEGLSLGALFYLKKPVTAEKLTEAVQSLGFVVVVTDVSTGRLGFRIIERP